MQLTPFGGVTTLKLLDALAEPKTTLEGPRALCTLAVSQSMGKSGALSRDPRGRKIKHTIWNKSRRVVEAPPGESWKGSKIVVGVHALLVVHRISAYI